MKSGDIIEYQTRDMREAVMAEIVGVCFLITDATMDVFRLDTRRNHTFRLKHLRYMRVDTEIGPKRQR